MSRPTLADTRTKEQWRKEAEQLTLENAQIRQRLDAEQNRANATLEKLETSMKVNAGLVADFYSIQDALNRTGLSQSNETIVEAIERIAREIRMANETYKAALEEIASLENEIVGMSKDFSEMQHNYQYEAWQQESDPT